MPIQVLKDEVASQIAAGEVVERPASVVKELVENALDAQASQITLQISDAGKQLIEIADNGIGIPPEEMALAVMRHATSKLQAADDLFHIQTLGFRGEALASIASVSRFTLTSRTPQAGSGTRLMVEGGHVGALQPVGAPAGSVVRVEELFYNVPARLKFLKRNITERQQIDGLVTRYALAYPQVRFHLFQDGKPVLQTSGKGDRREVLADLYGLEVTRQMLEVSFKDEYIRVEGFISPVALTRSNRKEITFFVNGRWVQDTSLAAALLQAYHTLLMVGRYPISILFITLDPEELDVNVHPAKSEVRFRSQDRVFSGVQRAVRRALLAYSPVPAISPENWQGNAAPSSATRSDAAEDDSTNLNWDLSRRAAAVPSADEWDALSSAPSNRDPDLSTAPWDLTDAEDGLQGGTIIPPETGSEQIQAGQTEAQSEFADTIKSTDSSAQPATSPSLPGGNVSLLRLVGQVGNVYLVAEGPDGLYLIDQHAAHERVLFERLMRQHEQATPAQNLLEPVTVQLPPAQARLLQDQLDTLAHLGFEVEAFGPNTFRVRAIPALLTGLDPAAAIHVVVEDFEEDETPLQAEVEARLIARVCKRAAVKAGQSLSVTEQAALLRDLEACQSPRTCPHGRPTMIHLSVDTLERQFGRRGAR